MIISAFVLVLIAGIVLAVGATIRHDGYGSRPAPRSHHDYFSASTF